MGSEVGNEVEMELRRREVVVGGREGLGVQEEQEEDGGGNGKGCFEVEANELSAVVDRGGLVGDLCLFVCLCSASLSVWQVDEVLSGVERGFLISCLTSLYPARESPVAS